MSTQEEKNTLHHLDVCMEIGNINNCNCHYQAGVSRRIDQTGKAIEELTVGELLTLIREHGEWFNKLYQP